MLRGASSVRRPGCELSLTIPAKREAISMGVYDYKNFGTADSKVLFSDAMAITLYSYHNLDNGFGLGLPATLVTALIGGTDSQGVIPGVPWNPDSEKLALAAVQKAGWTPITASQLGYDGKTDARGTFYSEKEI